MGANTSLVAGDPVAAVRAMNDGGERPMRTLGSLTLCAALLRAGLVDRFRVGVFPVLEHVPTVLDGPPESPSTTVTGA